jgi:hypothetical protein
MSPPRFASAIQDRGLLALPVHATANVLDCAGNAVPSAFRSSLKHQRDQAMAEAVFRIILRCNEPTKDD